MMDSMDQKWMIFTDALHEGDYSVAWLIAGEGVDGSLTQMGSVLLHTAIRKNQVPQALAAWVRTYQGSDHDRALGHIQKMLRVKTPLINPHAELEASINKALDEAYASCTDILYF